MAEFRHLVRIANTDIEGKKQLLYSLTKIKGVSIMYANAACKIANISTEKIAGELLDKEIEILDKVIREPVKNGFPRWLINRLKDYETGEDKHLLGGDLQFTKENDIKRMRKMKTYKGNRHGFRLTVRGQRTKSNFRRNKGKGLGVKRKK